MDLRLATLKAVSFYLLHNISTLNQRRKLSCDTVVCKHFASYQGYPNYRWDLPYFPVDNARVIYTKMFSKRKKTTVRVIHKVRVMQLKSKKFQNT
jgi:hypothetical protein